MSSSAKMQYVRLGSSRRKGSKIILGCMSYGDPKWFRGWVLAEETEKHIKATYAAGINTFDTANAYSNYLSEEVLGRATKENKLPRVEIAVITKLFPPIGTLQTQTAMPTAKHSLQRLDMEYIDVRERHRFDSERSIKETAYSGAELGNLSDTLECLLATPGRYSLVYKEEEREIFLTLKSPRVMHDSVKQLSDETGVTSITSAWALGHDVAQIGAQIGTRFG
ncbi:Aldo/keto reductase [Mycena vulgaris]|nr:Aldo/keto reductase [Mycena vulgaris]